MEVYCYLIRLFSGIGPMDVNIPVNQLLHISKVKKSDLHCHSVASGARVSHVEVYLLNTPPSEDCEIFNFGVSIGHAVII